MKNEKFSHKDFTNQSLSHEIVSDFDNTTIVGSCFYQEIPQDTPHKRVAVFPFGIRNVTFKWCNLENVFIPPGNFVDAECLTGAVQVQNDGEDWHLDSVGKPQTPVHEKDFIRLGISTSPLGIPRVRRKRAITAEKQEKPRSVS